ncbi:protein ANTHESIS POMOTING FACTOR 1 isoform X2 [Cryptomeria japonica]|nr:protein ANTHESIS POMOTING FACTOR 1 isoform X2 [Cryptomeria japonica]XP_057812575.2 protein ANTHESIS POMOTING FACTOR 1 isoform X2 [Cryptomeria japonica]XP_057812576.2 protein ANTHESIS POMOTING FACTOR 1 isoform X2 [Cryptomeria japonica]XP_057812577.2 protein ANTHESIS POMOTING FACTOR 1 isoform X2 [Cryptomeria japonica]
MIKTIYSKKYGVDLICFTHHPTSVLYSSKNGWDESLRHLSLMDNKYLRYFKGHHDRVVSLCMSPKSETFMSGSLDRTVLLWDLRTDKCQGLIRVRGRPAVAYDEQGLVFAISNEAGFIKMFDIRLYDKGPFETFLVEREKSDASGIKFSDDGRLMLLSTMGGNIHILDAYQGTVMHSFDVEAVPDSGTLEASFSPDGKFVISGSGNGNIHAWSVNSGKEVACWMNDGVIPAVVKWAPRRLMFASGSSVLSLWVPDLSKLDTHVGSNASVSYASVSHS